MLTEDQFKFTLLRLLGPLNTKQLDNIIIPRTLGPVTIKTNEEKMIEAVFESCAFKCFMSCVLGESRTLTIDHTSM